MSKRKLGAGVVGAGESHEIAERGLCPTNSGKRLACALGSLAAFRAAAVIAAEVTTGAANGKQTVDELLVNRGDLLAQLLGQVCLRGQVGQRRDLGQLRHDSLSARPALP